MVFTRNILKKALHSLGFEIFRYNNHRFSLGIDAFKDIGKLASNDGRIIVFDVGANEGQSVKHFKGLFPSCEIHSFEPSPTTYRRLTQNANNYSDVYVNNLALGSSRETKQFLENSYSNMSSFLRPGEICWGEIVKETLVEVSTLDNYCVEKNVPYVTVLKTDTQGYDFEVLKGASALFEGSRIQLILMEIIFSDMYKGLPSFDEIFKFLFDRGFRLVSFYTFRHQNNLASWSDALFLNVHFDINKTPPISL